MDKKLSRRSFLQGAATCIGASLLASCAPKIAQESSPTTSSGAGSVTTPPPAESKEVTYWTQWASGYPDALWVELKKLPEYKDIMGNYEVTCIRKLEDALVTAIAGGMAPDAMTNYNYLDYVIRGVCSPIDDYLAASTRLKKDDFYEGNWKICTWQGKTYGVPVNEAFVRYGMVMNTTLVEAAGLDPDQPPQTWDELIEWNQELTQFDSAKNLIKVGFDPVDFMCDSVWTTDGWVPGVSWDFTYFDENTGKFDLDNEKMIDYFVTFKKFTDVIGMDNLSGMHSAEGQGTWGPGFDAEVESIVIDGYWHVGWEIAGNPDLAPRVKYTWMPVPQNRKGVRPQLAGGHTVLTYKDSKVPEGVFRLQELLNTKNAYDVLFTVCGFLPASKTYIESFDSSKVPGLDFYFQSAKEATEWHSPEQCPIINFVGKTFSEVREKVFRGEMTPENAANDLQKRCEDEYKNAGFSS
jgi:multiple sugar transport system substrate-binding protein